MPSCALSARHSKGARSQLQLLGVVTADAEVLTLAVRKLIAIVYHARCGRAEDVMTVSLSSCTQQVLAVDMSKLDTKLVTAME